MFILKKFLFYVIVVTLTLLSFKYTVEAQSPVSSSRNNVQEKVILDVNLLKEDVHQEIKRYLKTFKGEFTENYRISHVEKFEDIMKVALQEVSDNNNPDIVYTAKRFTLTLLKKDSKWVIERHINLNVKKEGNIPIEPRGIQDNQIITLQSSTSYKFPWQKGHNRQWWTRGLESTWHDCVGNSCAIDFGTNNLNEIEVVASAKGEVSYICTGTVSQNVFIIDSSGVELGYYHFEKGTLDPKVKLDTQIEKGQYLGELKPGTWPGNGTVSDGCGRTQQTSNSAHLHFFLPNQFTLEGWQFSYPNLSATRNGVTKIAGDSFLSEVDDYVIVPRNNTDFPDTKLGDFNGDEKDDIIYVTPAGQFYVTLSNNSKFVGGVWTTLWEPLNKFQWDIGEMTGDNFDDLVVAIPDYIGNSTYFVVCPSNGSSVFSCQFVVTGYQGTDLQWDLANVANPDTDGKTRDDIIVVTNLNEFFVTAFKDTSGNYWSSGWGDFLGTIPDSSWKVAHLDNDNKLDVVVALADGKFYYGFSNGAGFESGLIHQHGLPLSQLEWEMADLNGDNKDDLIAVSPSNTYYASKSNPNNRTYSTAPWIIYTAHPRNQTRWRIYNADANNRKDILLIDPNCKFYAYVTNLAGTAVGNIYAMSYDSNLSTSDIKIGNFDADGAGGIGKEDIALTINDNRTFVIKSTGTAFQNGGLWMDLDGSLSTFKWKAGNYHEPSSGINPMDVIAVTSNAEFYVGASNGIKFNASLWLNHSGGGPLANNEWR